MHKFCVVKDQVASKKKNDPIINLMLRFQISNGINLVYQLVLKKNQEI